MINISKPWRRVKVTLQNQQLHPEYATACESMDNSYACIYHPHHMARSLYHRFLLYWQIILFGVSANFLFTACFPSQVEFEAGWATKRIEGKMLSDRGHETEADAFIIVLEYFSRFVQLEDHQQLSLTVRKNQEDARHVRTTSDSFQEQHQSQRRMSLHVLLQVDQIPEDPLP